MRLRLIRLAVMAVAVGAASLVLTTPARAGTLDCTTSCDQLFEGAYWQTIDQHSTGTGVISSFLRIQATGNEEGYNSDGRPLGPDVNTSPTFTRSLQLQNVPVVIIDGVSYYEFLLDINETSGQENELISLNYVEICTATSATLTENPTTGCPASATQRFEFGTFDSGTSGILMDYTLNEGSGSGDLFMYIPVSAFGTALGTDYVYLFSQFGYPAGYETGDGFEEWAVQQCDGITIICEEPLPLVPEPASIMLLGVGLSGLAAGVRRRRAKRSA